MSMQRVVIAEDEKMIRQGLKAMVMRSGIEVMEIVECKNGEEALEVLESQEVDVLFTDIRMPKMDGLTLLEALNERGIAPEIVVISGYDDFEYAVKALQCGAREYILKPVDREAIYKVMEKLESLLAEKNTVARKIEAIDEILEQQVKYILLNEKVTKQELVQFEQGFEGHWITTEPYQIFCTHEEVALPKDSGAICCQVEQGYVILCREETSDQLEWALRQSNVGISSVYRSVHNLRIAYEQAVLARRYAYMMNLPRLNYEDIPIQRNTQVADKELIQLVQLVGTERLQAFEEAFNHILGEESIEGLIFEDFEKLVEKLIGYLLQSYGSLINVTEFKSIQGFYQHADYNHYRIHLKDYLLALNKQICDHYDNDKHDAKLKEAVAYIHDNYQKDLNMAMVSNHISMNYSSFSQLFKEYAGMNFVNYIKEVRIEKAKELLTTTAKKVAEVGYAVGFENEKHFMKVFRSVTGISPTEYRKSNTLT